MVSVTEMKKANEARGALIAELRTAQEAMRARAPGSPAVEIPLDKILTFKGKDGELCGVIEVEQVIYLADEILRRGT